MAVRGVAVEYARALGRATGMRAARQLPVSAQEIICLLFALSKVPFVRPVGARVFVDERAAACLAVEAAGI